MGNLFAKSPVHLREAFCDIPGTIGFPLLSLSSTVWKALLIHAFVPECIAFRRIGQLAKAQFCRGAIMRATHVHYHCSESLSLVFSVLAVTECAFYQCFHSMSPVVSVCFF